MQDVQLLNKPGAYPAFDFKFVLDETGVICYIKFHHFDALKRRNKERNYYYERAFKFTGLQRKY